MAIFEISVLFYIIYHLFVIPNYHPTLYSGNSYVTLQLELCLVGS